MSSGNESDSEMEMEAEVCNVDPCDIVVLEVCVDPEAQQDPDINRDRGEDLDELIVVAADDEENEDEPTDDANSADIESSSSSSSIDDSSSESSAEDESVEEARRSPRRRNARFESSDGVEDARRSLRHRNSRLESTRSVQDARRPQRRRNARFGNNDSARIPMRLRERRNAISENTESDYEPMDTTSDNDLRNIQLGELEDEETDRRLLRTLQLHRAEYNERLGSTETTESRDILSSAGMSNVDMTDNAEMMDGNSEMRAGNEEMIDNSETVGNSEMTVNSAIVNPAAAIGIENASPYDLESSPEGILLRGTVISRPRRRRRRLTIYKKAGQIAFHSFGYINEEELRLNRAWLNARGYQTRILSAEERHAFLLQLARASAPTQTETSTCNQSTMTRNRRTNVSVQTSRIVRRATRRRASCDRLVLQWEIPMLRRRQVPLPRAPPQAPARSSSPPPTQRANLPNASQSSSSGTRSLHSVPRIKINNQTFEFSCPICLDSYLQHSPTITQCGHIFCKICLLRHCIFGGNNRYVCPLCLSRLNPNKFHRVYF